MAAVAAPLARRAAGWQCGRCERVYAEVDGVPLFTADRPRAERPIPLLDELWRSLDTRSVDDAAREFCELHGCIRNPASTDWKFFLPAPERGMTLGVRIPLWIAAPAYYPFGRISSWNGG